MGFVSNCHHQYQEEQIHRLCGERTFLNPGCLFENVNCIVLCAVLPFWSRLKYLRNFVQTFIVSRGYIRYDWFCLLRHQCNRCLGRLKCESSFFHTKCIQWTHFQKPNNSFSQWHSIACKTQNVCRTFFKCSKPLKPLSKQSDAFLQ